MYFNIFIVPESEKTNVVGMAFFREKSDFNILYGYPDVV